MARRKSSRILTPLPYVERGKAYRDAADDATIKRAIKASVYSDVPIAALHATQRHVSAARLLQYIGEPGMRSPDGSPIVVERGGKLYVYNGHHRASAAMARGDGTMRARVATLDGPRKFGAHLEAGALLMIAPAAMEATYAPHAEPCVRIEAGIAILTIDGPLDSKPSAGWWSSFDDYESILHRFREALDSPDVKAVLLKIDSPGGMAAGLNACCDAMRKHKRKSGKPVWAYADEKMCSAAYALACAADRVYLPPAAEIGSIGVTSTLLDATAANKKAGLRFAVVTSGARKADGDPNTPLTDAAIAHVQRRVDHLAQLYYQLVERARGIPAKKVQALQADTFDGQAAVTARLADGVQSLSRTMRALRAAVGLDADGSKVAQNGTADGTGAQTMSVKTAAKAIKRAESALRAAKGKDRVKAAKALADAAMAMAKEAAKTPPASAEAESSAEEEEEEMDSESDVPESSADEEEAKESAEEEEADSESPPPESSAESSAEDEEDAAGASGRAALALAQAATGKKGRKAIGALAAMIGEGARAAKRVATIERERRSEKKAAAIDKALTKHHIARSEAKMLRDKSSRFVRDFLSMRTKPIILTDETELRTEAHGASGEASGLSPKVMSEIEKAVQVMPKDQQEATRKALVAAQSKSLNGSAGRF